MEKKHESTKDLIDEIICRWNTIQKVKVDEEFDGALGSVFPSMIQLVGEYRIEFGRVRLWSRILLLPSLNAIALWLTAWGSKPQKWSKLRKKVCLM